MYSSLKGGRWSCEEWRSRFLAIESCGLKSKT